VTGDDHARLGDAAEELVTWLGNTAFLRLVPTDGQAALHRCVALSFDVEREAFSCSIYERRPQVCRDLQRGSPACHGELAAKADRPRRALILLREPR
jgi:hypothetical protein